MIHFPKKIKVGYTVYKIKHTKKKLHLDKIQKTGKYYILGECSFHNQVIKIFGKQGHDEFTNTLLHELLHAVNSSFKIAFKNDKIEEYYVTRYSDALVCLFKDNPKLLLWFLQKLNKEKPPTIK